MVMSHLLRSALSALLCTALVSASLSEAFFGGRSTAAAATTAGHSKMEDSGAEVVLPTLTVASSDAVVVSSTSEVEITVEMTNPTEAAVAGGDLELSLIEEPITSRTALSEALTGGESGEIDAAEEAAKWRPISTAKIGQTPASSQRTETLTVPRSDLASVQNGEVSVYMLKAEYTAAPEQTSTNQPAQPDMLTATAPVIFQGDITQASAASNTLTATVVVPLVLPSDVWSLPSKSRMQDLFAEDAALPQLLAAAETTHATLGIDPRILVAIRAHGDAAPENARIFLRDLEDSTLPSFLLQYGDADIAAQAAIGQDKLLQPTGATFVTQAVAEDSGEQSNGDEDSDNDSDNDGDKNGDRSGDQNGDQQEDTQSPATLSQGAESKSTQLTSTQTSSAKSDAGSTAESDAKNPADTVSDQNGGEQNDEALTIDPQAELAALAAWDETAGTTAWPADGEVNDATMQLVQSGDFERVILQDDNVTRSGGPKAVVSDIPALISDHELNNATREALAASSDTVKNHALSRTLALSALSLEKGSSQTGTAETSNAATDSSQNDTASGTNTSGTNSQGIVLVLDRGAIGDAEDPAAVLNTIRQASWLKFVEPDEQVDGRATLDAKSVNTDRADLLRAAIEREPTVQRTGKALAHPENLVDYHRMRLLTLFGTRWAQDTAGFADTAVAFRERDTELLNGLELIGGPLTQVFGSSSRIPVQVRNSLPFEAIVHGTVTPASGAIRVEDQDLGEIRVPAGESTTVLIPIQSRVTSGDSGIVVTLNSVNDQSTLSTKTFEVSISSQVETVAVIVLLVGAGLFVGIGIWRSVRRKRSPKL